MPKLPGPAIVVAAVALMLFGVSGLDALSAVWQVRDAERELTVASRAQRAQTTELERRLRAPRAAGESALLQSLQRETREQERRRAQVEALTARAIRSDGVGMLAALVLGGLAWLGWSGRLARLVAAATPRPGRAGTGRREPAVATLAATRFLDDDPDEHGHSADEVAAAVNRVRRQVATRYSRAAADRDELAAIVDTAFDAFVAIDGEGRITRWNSSAERLFGWSREEAIGRPVFGTALGPPDGEGPLAAATLRRLAAARPDVPVEFLAWHRSGRTFPVDVALISHEDGDEVYAFIRDISRRKRAERRQRAVFAVRRALAEIDAPRDAALEVARTVAEIYDWSAAVFWTDDDAPGVAKVLEAWSADGGPLRAWTEASRTARTSPGQGLVGRAWERGEILHADGADAFADDPRADAAEAAGLCAAICLPLVVDGATVGAVELAATAPRVVDDGLLDDLAAVQRAMAEVVGRRRAREASDRAKREFLMLVSHELRTPLTSIMGYVQMLRSRLRDAGADEQRSIEIVARNADRLNRLVGDLLYAAEINRGGLALEEGAVCLPAVVRDAVDAARPAAEARRVRLTVHAEPVAAVDGDAGRLSQVLDNLLSNAIKFSHEGGRVEVRLRERAGTVELAVGDEGIGVAVADVDRVSQQFFRAATARAAQVPGMGLGLSLSKAIVEGHGGELRFDSAEGKGTTVTVRLPAASAAPARTSVAA